ncbi:type II toxin-antitoxin system VapC family toxin [Nostoc sp. DSM 114167]|jgi:predicted nucleic acid-binding protein|uniref:type II toxin-antitoxin system VapC family toxin n=1 Tax=Nostoc sp. DSM 114167 TaxID=3439050 RepID=UPI00404573A0
MIIIDTGFWLALIDKKDTHHQRVKQALKQYNEPLITTWPVVTETCYLLVTRKGVEAEIIFLNSLQEELFTIFNLEPHHTPRIIELIKKYADLPMDLADASLVILAEYLGHGRIFSVDQRDFNTYRWKQSYPFENLLF